MSGNIPHDPAPEPLPPRVEPEPPMAREERSRWPGWIWGVPIAAVLIVAWLVFRQLAASGPSVTVVFLGAHGISAGQTTVEYNGLKVGQVESVKLEKDLRHVKAEIRLDGDMDGHIGKGTLFWINSPSLSDLSSIKSVISGPTIGMQPAPGSKQKVYEGLTEAPVVPEAAPGTHYVLQTSQLGSVARGSPIYFHSLTVGKVEDVALEPGQSFNIEVFVKKPYDQLVHDGTRFWNAGAVQISLAGPGPRVQLQSLPALLSGAVDFETPTGAAEGPVAPENRVFHLFESQGEAKYAPGPNAVPYRVVFGPEAGALEKGASVKLAGQQVGSVETAKLQYDPGSGKLLEQVMLAIEPSRIALPDGAHWPASGRTAMDKFMNKLIGEGLRAQPGSSIPLVGAKDVSLAFVTNPKPATLIAGNPPEIPTAAGGAGIDGIMTAVSGIASKLDGLPLDQIADNVKTITSRLAKLSKSPDITQSLDDLHRSLANVEHITATAKVDIPSLLASLRKVAANAESAVSAARNLISSTAGNGPMGLNTAGLTQTLYEVSRAAQSIRELTNYLDRHPSALIRGRQ